MPGERVVSKRSMQLWSLFPSRVDNARVQKYISGINLDSIAREALFFIATDHEVSTNPDGPWVGTSHPRAL